MKITLAALASMLLFVSLHAAPSGDAHSVLNSFLATFAKDNPAWKTDVVALTDPANVPAGRQLGYSAVLGYYSFLPKTWEQLSDLEKTSVYADSRLKPFIISLRNFNNYPTMTNTDTPKPALGVYPVEGFPARNNYAPTQYQGQYPLQGYIPCPPPGYAPMGYGMPTYAPAYPAPQYMPAYAPAPTYMPSPVNPMTGAYAPVYAPQASYMPAPQQYMPVPQQQYSAPSYAQAPMPYYSPSQLSPATALTQPLTVVQPQQPEMSRLRMTPGEMLLDRPLKIYMQNK